jgi:voltage-gated potassium channel Kch
MHTWLRDHHYGSILVAQILLLFVAALMVDHVALYVLFVLSLLGIFGTVIRTIWGDARWPRVVTVVCGALAVVGGFLWVVPGISEEAVKVGLAVCSFSYALFILAAILSIGRHVFITDRVTTNRIVGSICLYLLIGMFFAFVFSGIDRIHPQAFSMEGRTFLPHFEALRDFLYFSYSTLTTIGYGDMVAVRPIPKMLAVIEGMAGPIYLAIMVARLVGMHITQHHHATTK